MKILTCLILICTSLPSKASLNQDTKTLILSTFSLDSIDSISTKNKTVKIEDLRDGFDKIEGVVVTEELVLISSKIINAHKIILNLRNTLPELDLKASAQQVRSGGDAGGG